MRNLLTALGLGYALIIGTVCFGNPSTPVQAAYQLAPPLIVWTLFVPAIHGGLVLARRIIGTGNAR